MDLAASLKRLRVASGMSAADLGQAAGGWSQSKVSKIENGATVPSTPDVRTWSRVTRAGRAETTRLVEIANSVGSTARSYSTAYSRGMDEVQRDIARIEGDATHARIFTGSVLPGLLQSASYAEALFGMLQASKRAEIASAVAERMRRQEILNRRGKRFTFIIGALALRWLPEHSDPDLWANQVDKILTAASRRNVEVLVLPDRPGWPLLPLEAISFYESPDGDVALMETTLGDRFERRGAELAAASDRLHDLARRSLKGRAAEELILNSLA